MVRMTRATKCVTLRAADIVCRCNGCKPVELLPIRRFQKPSVLRLRPPILAVFDNANQSCSGPNGDDIDHSLQPAEILWVASVERQAGGGGGCGYQEIDGTLATGFPSSGRHGGEDAPIRACCASVEGDCF